MKKGTNFKKELHQLLLKHGRIKGWIAGQMGYRRGVFWGKVSEINGYAPFSEAEKKKIRSIIINGNKTTTDEL